MPFAPTNDLPPNPDVRIFFSGLMLIQPDANASTCEVFVNRSAPDHTLTIDVREKRTGGPDLIKMRHVGPLSFAESPLGFPNDPKIYGMVIKVDKSPKGVRSFDGTQPSPEGQPLSLAINLQGAQFHNGQAGRPDLLGGRPSILLNDAVFYAADLTDPRLTINLKRKNFTASADPILATLDPFASLLGANVYLEDGDQVLISWNPLGIREELKLEKPPLGVSYEIYVVNDPLYESDSIGVPPHDEFNEYYKILPAIPSNNQLRLEVLTNQPGAGAALHKGSTKTPCMSCILDP